MFIHNGNAVMNKTLFIPKFHIGGKKQLTGAKLHQENMHIEARHAIEHAHTVYFILFGLFFDLPRIHTHTHIHKQRCVRVWCVMVMMIGVKC